MKEMTIDGMKLVQMDILQVIHDFCLANDITYSLGCGTLLGAVRHKGFIPWDDDIDIYMPRADYQRFEALFPDHIGTVAFSSLDRDPSWSYLIGKAYDTRTICEETTVLCKTPGVNIDVFPIDNVPAPGAGWEAFDRRRRLLHRGYFAKYLRLKRGRNLLKLLVQIAVKTLTAPVSIRNYARFLDRGARRYNDTKTGYMFESVQGWSAKNPFPASVFDKIVMLPFEDRTFCAMGGYDTYLRAFYGDYMKLPPADKQVAHHSFKAGWRDDINEPTNNLK